MKSKLMKKILSAGLSVLLVCSTLSLPAFAQPSYVFETDGQNGNVPTAELLFSENFDGTVQTAEGSTWGEGAKTLTVQKNETTATVKDKSLSVKGTANTSKALQLKRNEAVKGKFAVEFNFKLLSQGGGVDLLFGAGYTDGTNETKAVEIGIDARTIETVANTNDANTYFRRNLNYKDSEGNKNPLVNLTSSRRIANALYKWWLMGDVESAPWASYARDWYTLKVVMDTNTSTYSVYLNGSLCQKNVAFANNGVNWAEAGINLPFMMATSITDAVLYDSIKIYREPEGRTTLYANDFNNYDTEILWDGSTTYATQRKSLFAGVAGLGLANTQAKGKNIYARNNALVTEYRNGYGGAFATGITMDDNMTLDMDFTVNSFTEDDKFNNYARVLTLVSSIGEGVCLSVSNDGKLIYSPYNLAIDTYPTILTTITLDSKHHLTLHMNYENRKADLYIDGVLVKANMGMLRDAAEAKAKNNTAGYFLNGEDITIGLGYHKESPTTDVTYDNLVLYKDVREDMLTALQEELQSIFSGATVVKGNITLPHELASFSGYEVVWNSENSIISVGNDGYTATVTPEAGEKAVILTAKVSDASGEYSLKRSFNVIVPADDSMVDISSLADWTVEEGTPLLTANPANEADKTVCAVASSKAYKTVSKAEGEAEASIELYMDKKSAGSVYLADGEGNAFIRLALEYGALKTEENGILKNSAYSFKKWFTLKLDVDFLKRTYNVFIDGEKVNGAPVSFVSSATEDKAELSRIGFATESGKIYINDIEAKTLEANEGAEIRKIVYTDNTGKTFNAPMAGKTVSYVEISNTFSDKATEVFVAVYDDNNTLKSVQKKDITSLKKGISQAEISNLTIPTDYKEGYKVKAFVWSTDGMAPLANASDKNSQPAVYIVGDSTAADYGAELYPYSGWGTELKTFLNEKTAVLNMAQAGSTAKAYVESDKFQKMQKQILPGDYLLIASAYDDAAANTVEADYKESLKKLALAAKENGATPVFVTSPAPKNTDISSYVTYMKEVATELGAPVLDLNEAWSAFMAAADDDDVYYGNTITGATKSDYRWEISKLNAENDGYAADETEKDGRLSPLGAQKAALLLANALNNAELNVSENVIFPEEFGYSTSNGVLTVSGSGKMPVFASFSETPWAEETGITTVKVTDGITSVSTDAFSGFDNLEKVYLADSVSALYEGAFPENITIYGSNNTVGKRYADEKQNIKFALEKFRILAIGNSHSKDYSDWRELIFNDLKTAGLETEIVFDRITIGGAQLYYKDILYVNTTNEYRSHYVQGSNPNRPYYNEYAALRDNVYDLVLVQDYRESVMSIYRYSFDDDLEKVVRWIKNEQPNADVAWVSDWSDLNSSGGHRGNLENTWKSNSVEVMKGVNALTEDAPDFVVPMSTALQNARTSYLGSVYNAADCYSDNANTDWCGSATIANYSILERDGTHCSYELGRYIVSTAVFGKVFDVYKNYLDGAENMNFFQTLKTTPEHITNGKPWYGSMTDEQIEIACESAINAINTPLAVTQSTHTTDPADGIAESVEGLAFSNFTAEGIANTVNAANLGITISASDVTVSENTATITFLYGYTKKTVTVS